MTLALSRDGGRTFGHAAPPRHFVAGIPYPYQPDSGPAGIFNPSNIVRSPRDGLLYAFVRAEAFRDQPTGACLMRTADLSDATSWRAWDGREFGIRFIDPYRQPAGSPNAHVCQPVDPDAIATMHSSVVYHRGLDRFLLVGASEATRDGRRVSGVFYSFSDDLIHWSPRALLLEAELTWSFRCGDADPIAYPSLLDPSSDSLSFDTIGDRPYLYLTRFHYDSCRQALDRDLVRIPLELSR